MLPGPASTQMGIYLGYLQAGHWGAIVSGVCFIAPAYLIVLALSWGYFQFQDLPQVHALFLGISPVVTAIVLSFCWTLGKKILKDWQRITLTIVVFLITALTAVSVLLQFVVCGLLGCWWFRCLPPAPPSPSEKAGKPEDAGESSNSSQFQRVSPQRTLTPSLRRIMPAGVLPLLGTTASVLPLSGFWGFDRLQDFALPLTIFFLKVGSFIFGGGLVIIPLLEFEVVERLQWLSHTEFINGVAIGQLSPGPVVLTAAFVGYKVAGVVGSLIATIAIFLPSFLFILLATPLLLRLRQNLWIKAFLQGVTPAVLGAITAASLPIAQASLIQSTLLETLVAFGLLSLSLVALLCFKTPTWQLVPAGAIVGLLYSQFL